MDFTIVVVTGGSYLDRKLHVDCVPQNDVSNKATLLAA